MQIEPKHKKSNTMRNDLFTQVLDFSYVQIIKLPGEGFKWHLATRTMDRIVISRQGVKRRLVTKKTCAAQIQSRSRHDNEVH